MSEEIIAVNREIRLIELKNSGDSEALNQWIFETISPFLKGRIIEIGSGTGQLAKNFVANAVKLHLSDPIEYYCQHLQNQFAGKGVIKAIHQINLALEHF